MEPNTKKHSSPIIWIIFLVVLLLGPAITLKAGHDGGALVAAFRAVIVIPVSAFVCALIALPGEQAISKKSFLLILLTVAFCFLEIMITMFGDSYLLSLKHH